jgi:hypothetical protein
MVVIFLSAIISVLIVFCGDCVYQCRRGGRFRLVVKMNDQRLLNWLAAFGVRWTK